MKYMGSKSRIAKYIVPIIQSYINNDFENTRYCEPFVGGANVIDKIKCPVRIGADINKYLIALLQHVQCGRDLYEEVPKDLYNKTREFFYKEQSTVTKLREFEPWEIGNIGFLASYNGRFFDGGYAKSGYEKTKTGLRYRNYYKESANNLLVQAPNLIGISFITADYRAFSYMLSQEYVQDKYKSKYVVYVDPPYQGTKQFSNSTKFDYAEFWETMRKWSTYDNCIVLISEEHAPEDFECIWEQSVSRSIKATDKSYSTEKLFKYKG